MKNYTIWAYDAYYGDKAQEEVKKEFIELYEHTPSQAELDEYCDFLSHTDFDDVITEILCHENIHGTKQYIVLAKIGTWLGQQDGGKIIEGLADVIYKCREDYDKIFYNHNQLCIDAIHHDGTNKFVIRELTDAGIDFLNRHKYDYSDRELHQKLFHSTKYSHMVSLFPKVYGWQY